MILVNTRRSQSHSRMYIISLYFLDTQSDTKHIYTIHDSSRANVIQGNIVICLFVAFDE